VTHLLFISDLSVDADWAKVIAAGFIVGVVVGITGMGGGALMTPALIFLGVGGGVASTVVTSDLTAAAVYKSGVHSCTGRAGHRTSLSRSG
jgi:uncharacterized membrane protein YfcA